MTFAKKWIQAQIRNAEAESRSGSRRGRRQSSTNSFVQTRMSVEDLETDNSTSLYSRSLNNDQVFILRTSKEVEQLFIYRNISL